MPDDQRNNGPQVGSASAPFPAVRRSLTRRALVMMGLRIALVIVIVTVLSYLHVYRTLRGAALDELRQRMALTARAESAPFLLAEHQAGMVRDEFLRRLALLGERDPLAEFARLFTRDADGVIHVRPELDDHHHHATAFLPREAPLTPDLRRRLVVGWELMDQWGPMLTNRFFSGFINTPERLSLGFRPAADPAGTAGALPDVCAGTMSGQADPRQNPTRAPFWTDVCFNAAAAEWLVSCVVPGDLAGRWVMSAGQEVRLADLIRRTASGTADGASGIGEGGPWAFIIDGTGRLIAHPQFAERIAKAGGNLSLDGVGDEVLRRDAAAALAAAPASGSTVVDPPGGDAILGVARIAGPGWLLVSVHPNAQQAELAFATARTVLLLGAAALALELAILAFIMRRHIAAPIADFVAATERISRGDFAVRLDHRRDDELGRLAAAINRMAKAVGDRDAAIALQLHELDQARTTAETANQTKAEFLGTMSHELRTPLNGVIGMTELLSKTPLTAKQRDYAETISMAGRSLLAIIDDILDFTRLNAGKLRLEPRPADLSKVVAEATAMVRQQATAKGLELRVDFAKALPIRVYADPARIRQVLVNLATNAVKFTERGQVTVSLACAAITDGKAEIHLAVSDTGLGIAPEHLPLLGERFQQLDSGFSRHHGGTGLGLSITKSLLALMDGELRVTSTLGSGSTFTAVMRLRLST